MIATPEGIGGKVDGNPTEGGGGPWVAGDCGPVEN